jgi:hypothetical protein
MDPQLIKVGERLIINARHVAYAEWERERLVVVMVDVSRDDYGGGS